MNTVVVFAAVAFFMGEVMGHGIFLYPPNRSTLWRTNKLAPINYNDNGLNCGGFHVQYSVNGGKCGLCGDSYSDPRPRNNENTGKFGRGIIAVKFKGGSVVDVKIKLTANHLGAISYSLCRLSNPNAPESGEHCFKPLRLADGSSEYKVSKNEFNIINKVILPKISCERCVMRWNYRAGNNWGMCNDGSSRLGCGPQETFRSCADISIF